ncbi:LacI family DNA-binding transcriptional regulator [Paucisalibacillus sp. EB02]|uniref:LacI family DNA-binding transcriptional regulator n=1 Tax=Paucisalibacillus sp. EB02 TaxID=1347087 RepID=UPI0004B8C256|nr:LacI family DNA-binding transcriptional regulator [Paucisalibacillus sp. EB02]
MTTIREVAKKAGVSVATVSRVINQNGYVKDSTFEKVQEAIKELNYRPSAIAVSLNNKKTKTIGLILPDITNPFFPELAKAVEEVANNYGYTMILCNSSGTVKNEIDQIELLQSKYVDGIILASDSFVEKDYKDVNLPMVLLDRGANPKNSSIRVNNFYGGVLATEHLLEQGCIKIAHLAGPKHVFTGQQRLEGYRSVVESMKWFDEKLVAYANYQLDDAITATKELLNKNKGIDGIFAGNDLMAIGCIKAIHSFGLSVPEDIAVIGFDGISLTNMIIPELSTIKQPIYEMGKEATNQIIKEIEGNHKESRDIEFDVTLIQRESTNRKRRPGLEDGATFKDNGNR